MLSFVGTESEVHVLDNPVAQRPDHDAAAGMLLAAIGEYDASVGSGACAFPCADVNEVDGMFLPNGARIYLDHGYLEYSTPECAETAQAVAAVRAGDQIVRWAAAKVGQATGNGRIVAVRNNRDYAPEPHSYGSHVNIRMTRTGFERIFSDREVMHAFVIPLFVALPVICGSGTVDTDRDRAGFSIWQRGPFLKTVVGPQTQTDRPLVNSRDEPLAADPEQYARFHVIAFDANVAEVAEYCKLGLLRLLCAAIDAGRIELDMELADPIGAVRGVSRDPFANLRRALTGTIRPLEILGAYHAFFTRLQRAGVFDGRVPDAGDILARSGRVLQQLRKDPLELVGVLDWPTKFAWLERFREQQGLRWSDPRVKWQDIQYHCLTGGTVSPVPCGRITTDEQVNAFMSRSPAGSRAEVRGETIRKFGGEILGMDWSWFVCRDGKTAYALPDDPADGAMQSAERAKTLKNYAESLSMDPIPITPIVIVPCTGRGDSEKGTEACHVTCTTQEA